METDAEPLAREFTGVPAEKAEHVFPHALNGYTL
jgi:hypothetical protein